MCYVFESVFDSLFRVHVDDVMILLCIVVTSDRYRSKLSAHELIEYSNAYSRFKNTLYSIEYKVGLVLVACSIILIIYLLTSVTIEQSTCM